MLRSDFPSESVSLKVSIPSSEGMETNKNQCIIKTTEDKPDKACGTSVRIKAITHPEKKVTKRKYSESEASNSDMLSSNSINTVDQINKLMPGTRDSVSETQDIASVNLLYRGSNNILAKWRKNYIQNQSRTKCRALLKETYESVKKLLGLEGKKNTELLQRCNKYVQCIKSMVIYLSDKEIIISFFPENIGIQNGNISSETNNSLIDSEEDTKDKKGRDKRYLKKIKNEINRLKGELMLEETGIKTAKDILEYFCNWVERWNKLVCCEVQKRLQHLTDISSLNYQNGTQSLSDTPSIMPNQKNTILAILSVISNVDYNLISMGYKISYEQVQIEGIKNSCNVFGDEKFRVISLVFDYFINGQDRYLANEKISNVLESKNKYCSLGSDPVSKEVIADLTLTSEGSRQGDDSEQLMEIREDSPNCDEHLGSAMADLTVPSDNLKNKRTIDPPLFTLDTQSSPFDSTIDLDDIVGLL